MTTALRTRLTQGERIAEQLERLVDDVDDAVNAEFPGDRKKAAARGYLALMHGLNAIVSDLREQAAARRKPAKPEPKADESADRPPVKRAADGQPPAQSATTPAAPAETKPDTAPAAARGPSPAPRPETAPPRPGGRHRLQAPPRRRLKRPNLAIPRGIVNRAALIVSLLLIVLSCCAGSSSRHTPPPTEQAPALHAEVRGPGSWTAPVQGVSRGDIATDERPGGPLEPTRHLTGAG